MVHYVVLPPCLSRSRIDGEAKTELTIPRRWQAGWCPTQPRPSTCCGSRVRRLRRGRHWWRPRRRRRALRAQYPTVEGEKGTKTTFSRNAPRSVFGRLSFSPPMTGCTCRMCSGPAPLLRTWGTEEEFIVNISLFMSHCNTANYAFRYCIECCQC